MDQDELKKRLRGLSKEERQELMAALSDGDEGILNTVTSMQVDLAAIKDKLGIKGEPGKKKKGGLAALFSTDE